MADNYIENLLENYPNFLLAIDRIIKLEPRRINQHENPQEKHNIPNEQFQVVIPRHIPHNITSQQYRNPKSKKKRLRNSSLPQKTQSDDLKSYDSQKKLKNDLTAQPHSPYHTPKHSQSSQSDQFQKRKKEEHNNYKKKKSETQNPHNTNPLKKPQSFGKMYLDTQYMITRVTLYPIPTRLTEEEDFRIKNYIKNPQFNPCKHDYIDLSSPYMFRSPLVLVNTALLTLRISTITS